MISATTHHVIDEAGVDAVLDAAEQHARQNRHRVVIAVVDRSGELVGLRRTPGAQVASSRVAVDKARTAAIFVRPSRELEQQVSSGRLGALALHGARALTGGIPLKVGDEVVGAIGTSGETPDEDEAVSIAGAAAGFSTTSVPALSAADADRADHMVFADDRDAALQRDCARQVQRGGAPARGLVLEVLARPAIDGGRARLVGRDPDARHLRTVRAPDAHQVASGIDDRAHR